ncbi:MAG: histidinol dehydrogenase [Eubacteriales bacterium]|nr:histidinol dehydrogenase [Eubacteriales bacterium]
MIKIIDMRTARDETFLAAFKARGRRDMESVMENVREIIRTVRENGDKAVNEFTLKFDGVELANQGNSVSETEIRKAYDEITPELMDAVRKASENIRRFHEEQKQLSWTLKGECGSETGQIAAPLENAGVYVPGGTAPLISSVLMNVIPASVAGVKNIYMATPPGKNGKIDPAMLVAANESGVKKIYKVGGAQAIAALAYGTETIPAVDKITGPGNVYVACAKRLVYGDVDIDMIAGPSEVLIIADDSADPAYIAADMLSQAEHDTMAAAVLITDSPEIAEAVGAEIDIQYAGLGRKDIIKKSIEENSAVILTENIDKAAELSNLIAPEHLELCVADPRELLKKIRNAGSVFLGEYSPEPVGDYFAGPNHVLPTGGTARFYSPLGVYDFVKRTNIIAYTKAAFEKSSEAIVLLAEAEGLTAHANAVRIRKKGLETRKK